MHERMSAVKFDKLMKLNRDGIMMAEKTLEKRQNRREDLLTLTLTLIGGRIGGKISDMGDTRMKTLFMRPKSVSSMRGGTRSPSDSINLNLES